MSGDAEITPEEAGLLSALARVFAPDRAGLDAALAALSDLAIDDVRAWRAVAEPAEIVEALGLDGGPEGGAAAWETLQARGILPAEYDDPAGRAFVHPELYPSRWSDESVALARAAGKTVVVFQGARSLRGPDALGRGSYSHVVEHRALAGSPLSVADALALGSDARGVVTAESLVHEHAARLEAWGHTATSRRVLWHVLGPGMRMSVDEEWHAPEPPLGLQAVLGGAVRHGTAEALLERLSGPLWDDPASPSNRAAVRNIARRQLWFTLAWAARADEGARVPRHLDVPTSLWGAPFAELPDPFEPLRSLWATGYVLQGFYDEGAIVLAPREAEPVAAVRATTRRDRGG